MQIGFSIQIFLFDSNIETSFGFVNPLSQIFLIFLRKFFIYSSGGRNRTANLSLTGRLLLPVELRRNKSAEDMSEKLSRVHSSSDILSKRPHFHVIDEWIGTTAPGPERPALYQTELRRYVLEFRRYGLVGKVGFEPTKPEGSGFTVRPNSPSLALTLVRPVIYSLVTEDFTQLTLMPLFFAIEPSN